MTFDEAIEAYLVEMQAEGRINSPHTMASYRSRLDTLSEQVRNCAPARVTVDDVAATLARWPNPSTGQHARSIYVSFFDWCAYRRMRKDNPARATRPRKVRKPTVYRLSTDEVVALFQACRTVRETRLIRLGCCAGLRNQELRGLQLRHFKRPGAIWVSPDIAKGGRERYIPVIAELGDVVAQILAGVRPGEYVIAPQRPAGGRATGHREMPELPCSPYTIRRIVAEVGRRAGIEAPIHPHLLRHAFGDHVARQADVRTAQATLGHASISTTTGTYTGDPTLQELGVALRFFRYDQRHGDDLTDETTTRTSENAPSDS